MAINISDLKSKAKKLGTGTKDKKSNHSKANYSEVTKYTKPIPTLANQSGEATANPTEPKSEVAAKAKTNLGQSGLEVDQKQVKSEDIRRDNGENEVYQRTTEKSEACYHQRNR